MEKEIHSGKINRNVTSKGCQAVTGLSQSNARQPFLKKRHKPRFEFLTLLFQIRFIAECMICNALVLSLLPVILPLVLIYFILKKLEQFVEYRKHRAIPMTGEDAIWRLQDSDTNRLIITSIIFVDCPRDVETALKEFRKVVQVRLVEGRNSKGELAFRRLGQIIRSGYFQYFFEDDANLDMMNHVFKYEGDQPKSKQELESIVSKMCCESFPENQSPWYFCCVPTEFGEKHIALIFRMHHSMADGVSLARLLTRVLPDHYIPQEEARRFTSYERRLVTAKTLFIMVRCVVSAVLRFADHSILHGNELIGKKKCVWSEPFELKLVKQIKNATGTTVNDVIMACLSLSIRRYFLKHGIKNPPDFTASIPIDVGPPTEEVVFQNKLASAFLKLPASIEGTLDTLYETKARMDVVKTSGEPQAMARLMSMIIEYLPEFATKPLISFISRKASCLLSNVPGPQHFLSISGNPVKYLTFWPPQRSKIGVGLSIYSYAGQVVVGAQGDLGVLSDPEVVTELFEQALQELATCVLGGETLN